MANSQSPSGAREQGRQQTSALDKTNSPSAQQGSQGNDPARQQSAWQSPSAEQQSSGPVQARGATPLAASYMRGFDSGPLSMIRRISEDMDRLFESFGFGRGMFPIDFGRPAGGGFSGQEASSLWMPHIELYEHDGKLVVDAELPGVKKEDVHVEIAPDAVTIRGERKQEKTSGEGGLYRSERSYGSFHRTIPLPEGVDAETASASFRDGVLHIEINAPQRHARVRKLLISDGGTSTTSRATTGSESQQMGGGSQPQQR